MREDVVVIEVAAKRALRQLTMPSSLPRRAASRRVVTWSFERTAETW